MTPEYQKSAREGQMWISLDTGQLCVLVFIGTWHEIQVKVGLK